MKAVHVFLRWLPEIAAFFASLIIATHLGMSAWQWIGLFVCLDLMTATGKQLDKARGAS